LPYAEGVVRSFGSSLARKIAAAGSVGQDAAGSQAEKASKHWSTPYVLSTADWVLQDLSLEAS